MKKSIAEKFEELFSECNEKLSNDDKYLITQRFTPWIQIIFVYCLFNNDTDILKCFEFPSWASQEVWFAKRLVSVFWK